MITNSFGVPIAEEYDEDYEAANVINGFWEEKPEDEDELYELTNIFFKQ